MSKEIDKEQEKSEIRDTFIAGMVFGCIIIEMILSVLHELFLIIILVFGVLSAPYLILLGMEETLKKKYLKGR